MEKERLTEIVINSMIGARKLTAVDEERLRKTRAEINEKIKDNLPNTKKVAGIKLDSREIKEKTIRAAQKEFFDCPGYLNMFKNFYNHDSPHSLRGIKGYLVDIYDLDTDVMCKHTKGAVKMTRICCAAATVITGLAAYFLHPMFMPIAIGSVFVEGAVEYCAFKNKKSEREMASILSEDTHTKKDLESVSLEELRTVILENRSTIEQYL